jgi:tetratricopeptide (TPR) repeat protein
VPAQAITGGGDGTGVNLPRIAEAIATWSANLDRDPADFIAAVNLSALYLERGHLTSDAGDLDAALGAIEQAIETDPSLPAPRLQRIQVLLASHAFADAERAATTFLADQPDEPAALAALGDARLELGDLAGAAAAWAKVGQDGAAPMIARRARLAMLSGSLAEAARLADDALGDPGTGDPAFYHLLAGTIAFQSGDLERSLSESEAALDAEAGNPGALAAIGRAQAARGDRHAAIASYELAVETRPDVQTLTALGDLLALDGRADEAEARYAEVRAIAADPRQERLEGRAIALFLADHGESHDRAVDLAEADLAARQDVHAWDAHAWALHAAGRHADAYDAMQMARAEGTEESLLDYHAGMIAAALGRTDEARELLQSALERNPAFDPIGAERAREALAGLDD